jgi:hypothetical protein
VTYRDMDDGTALRGRVEALEAKVERAESAWRSTVWAGWRTVGWVLLAAAPVALVLWIAFRGSLWGDDARRAAESAATRWGRTYWPSLRTEAVYCQPHDTEDKFCTVRFPDNTTWRIVCDDDAPFANDGCEWPRYVPAGTP